MTDRFHGQRITVMGLGTRGGGLGVARYLAEQGAVVTVTDQRPEHDLQAPMAELAGFDIRFVLGRHDEHDFTLAGADVVVRNPGVRRTSPYLQMARASGVHIEMEMSIFMRVCPAPMIGVTGTKGKTTTASLCGEMLRQWQPETLLAGNMGVSAVASLGALTPETPVVLELSSWQLEALDEHGLAPAIAVLTNISEDHLDAYDGFDDYAETKRSITSHLSESAVAILNADDPESWAAARVTKARVIPFGMGSGSGDGAWVTGRTITWRTGDRIEQFEVPNRLPYLGDHQLLNAAAAVAAAKERGAPADAVQRGIESFAGVYNRMETVAEIDGVTYINDTAATAPAAAIANLTGLASRRVHAIAGGFDKKSDLTGLADALATYPVAVYLLEGTATPGLADLIRERGRQPEGPFDSMEAAVRAAASVAQPGDVVILSPGCASFGLFRDEFDRGDKFREAVAAMRVGEGALL